MGMNQFPRGRFRAVGTDSVAIGQIPRTEERRGGKTRREQGSRRDATPGEATGTEAKRPETKGAGAAEQGGGRDRYANVNVGYLRKRNGLERAGSRHRYGGLLRNGRFCGLLFILCATASRLGRAGRSGRGRQLVGVAFLRRHERRHAGQRHDVAAGAIRFAP